MSDTPSANVIVGSPVTLATTLQSGGVPTDAVGAISCIVVNPLGAEQTYGAEIAHVSTGVYRLALIADVAGLWHWRWVVDGQATEEGSFTAETEFAQTLGSPDLTDLRVLVPRARRVCEGPFGPAPRPPLLDSQLYEMCADACADVILFTGTLFGHQLIVAQRDALAGFATGWKTDMMLTEWECALLVAQVGLNYHFFLLRDMRTSVTIKNEGTEYGYSLSANVLRDYLKELTTRRDLALAGLQRHHPVLDRYASNIRVRDQATVAILEWWDTNSPDTGGGGMPGGQEAAVLPWTPGWTGP